jgi:DNA-binding response OmpR family regulator
MSRSRPRVVFSDPFHDEVQMYASALEFVGFEVVALTEPDLTRAVAKVRELQPDAVVTRILPLRFGIELVLQLRKDPQLGRIPMLILTSLTQPEILRDARASGANEVLVIPVGPDAVARRLRYHLRQRRRG